MFENIESITALRLGLIDTQTVPSIGDVREHRAHAFLDAMPSKRILLSVDDIEAAERSPHYTVEMTIWHAPDRPSGLCSVCLAGAVLANRHPIRPDQIYVGPFDTDAPNEYATSAHWDRILSSLDALRSGYVNGYMLDDGRIPDEAVETFMTRHGPHDPDAPFLGFVPYDDDPAAFKAWARDVAGKLAAAGY